MVNLRDVHAAVRNLEPLVHRGDHEEREHGVPDVVKVQHRVDPLPHLRVTVWALKLPHALIEVGDRGVRAPPEHSAENLHAEDAKHHNFQ